MVSHLHAVVGAVEDVMWVERRPEGSNALSLRYPGNESSVPSIAAYRPQRHPRTGAGWSPRRSKWLLWSAMGSVRSLGCG